MKDFKCTLQSSFGKIKSDKREKNLHSYVRRTAENIRVAYVKDILQSFVQYGNQKQNKRYLLTLKYEGFQKQIAIIR